IVGRRRLHAVAGTAIEIMKARLGAELGVHLEALVLLQQPRDVAVRIVEIAEMQRVGDTCVDASRRRAWIEAGREPILQAEIDAVRAEGAFLRDADALRIRAL